MENHKSAFNCCTLAAALTLTCGACKSDAASSTPQDIFFPGLPTYDKTVEPDVIPDVRVRWQFTGRAESESRRPRAWLELEAIEARSESRNLDVSLSELSLSCLLEWVVRKRLHLQAGAGLVQSEASVVDVGVVDYANDGIWLKLQGSASYDLTSFLAPYLRVEGTTAVENASGDRIELGLSWRLCRFAALSTGYLWWSYEDADYSDQNFDGLTLAAEGPVIGLVISL